MASALGEFFERLACNYFFADYYLGVEVAQGDFVHYPQERWFLIQDEEHLPEGLLDPLLMAFYNPDDELRALDLIDCNSGNAQRGICTLPYIRQSDQKEVFIPVNIIGNLYVSNGMAAGNSQDEARVQALSEVLERFVKNRIISEGLCLPQIPTELLARFPYIQQAVETIKNEGFSLYLYDASLGGQFPVISVVLLNPDNGGCYAAFGAHPQFEVALERTVTELLQGRSLTSLNEFPEPSFDLDEVGEHHNLETHFIDSSGVLSWTMLRTSADFDFVHWNFEGDTQAEFNYLLECLSPLESDVYIADYTHLGVYACRIVVPGVSEIYPVDDLKWQNNNAGNSVRELIFSLPKYGDDHEYIKHLFEALERLDLDDAQPVADFIGIIADPNSAWQTLRIGELKALMALAIGEFESALEGILWTLDFSASSFSTQRLAFYRALRALLELELANDIDNQVSDYWPALTALYSKSAVLEAKAHLSGELSFAGLTVIDMSCNQLQGHMSLLKAYQKLQKAKHQEL